MNRKWIGIFVGLIIAAVLAAGVAKREVVASDTGVIAFGAQPAFASEAVDGEASQQLSDIGMSAYLQSGQTIDLEELTGTFETIEAHTDRYIIGSVSLPEYGDQQGELFHVHVYADVDGWLLAYFMDDTPAAKIIDWKAYVNSSGTSVVTLLEQALSKVASEANVPFAPPTYYDFRYPDATHLMLIADITDPRVVDQFQIELPSSYVFHETSWGLYRYGYCCFESYWRLNGTAVSGSNIPNDTIAWGTVPISSNDEHLIEFNYTAGLAIVYKEG